MILLKMAVFNLLYIFFQYIGSEFLTFVLIDVLAKSRLREAANDQEKRSIWLYESVCLSIICILIYLFHHVPYLLIIFTSITFVYTQVFGRTDLTNAFANLRSHWENHLQHEESMKQIERQKQQQQQLQQQALGLAGVNQNKATNLNNQVIKGHELDYGQLNFLSKHANLQYPPNATVIPGNNRPTYSMGPSSASYREAIEQSSRMLTSQSGRSWNNVGSFSNEDSLPFNLNRGQYDNKCSRLQDKDSNDKKTLWSNTNLQRRSLHHSQQLDKLPKSMPSSTSIKNKFMNVIGFRPTIPKPVGLVNNGQNMCFINSVVQCLARSPFLVECITADAAKELECNVAESNLLSSLAELLDILTIDPSCSDNKAFNATRFRKAVSGLNPSLVSPPGEQLKQQDAAEFLMWLLATVHTILNKNSQVLECDPASITNDDRFSSPRLTNLKLIYGDLNTNRINELKDQCRREIAVANGLENESYAEAIQRLSDLEWLTHKQANDTVIDNLFTGQLVEAYHNVQHGHISVNLQAFNVLPVPIASPRYSSGPVFLEDCFTSFCNIENLPESSELNGDDDIPVSQNTQLSSELHHYKNGGKDALVATPVSRKLVNQELQVKATTYMPSPIQLSVSPSSASSLHLTATTIPQNYPLSPPTDYRYSGNVYFDNNAFRTSTPILGENAFLRKQTKLQRRCLLRQLPECLIVQLMRFKYDPIEQAPTKITTSVNIRLHNLNLKEVIYDTVTHRSDLTASTGSNIYQLYGLCLHLGASSTSYGHYINYCLDGVKWFRMDDQTVTEVNMEYQLNSEEIRQNAYLLFYRRVNSDGS